ncbi:MAG: 5-formyltetrahydrofolate cyclo-ligase [Candidatus Omnitrophica bacterium]|nr:5-formyltetrahydrofolate cyclo-ligase [Candidatus Omnitrophota bacterium]
MTNTFKDEMQAGLKLTKAKIRSKILLKLLTQREEDRKQKSAVISKKLFRLKEFKKAKTVMFYIAFKGEVDTTEMIKEAIKLGKKVTVPVCDKNNRLMGPCLLEKGAHLRNGPYGVKEPVNKICFRLDQLDLVLVPGVAFDKKGNRLGRGKGFYDRMLSKLARATPAIGVAFDFQVLPCVPVCSHDVSVKKVLVA